MQFNIEKVSDMLYNEKVEIETLQDLQKLQERYNNVLIIDFTEKVITVLDDYME